MKPMPVLLMLALAAPAASFAQASRSQVRIEPPVVYSAPVYSGPVQACLDRQDTLADRKAWLDREKIDLDRTSDAIALEGQGLADELRTLPASDAAAVAAYNARSDAHNRRVASYNQRAAEMNGAAASLNSDSADMVAYCNYRSLR